MTSALRVSVTPLEAGELLLPEEAARYVARVHRLVVGDRLELFDPQRGSRAAARLIEVSKRRVRCAVDEPVLVDDSHRLPVSLVQGLSKADKPERVVRDATALGAARVVLVESQRSTAKLAGDQRAAQRRARLEAVACEAARQCERPRIPDIVGPLPFAEWLPEISARSLLLDPRARLPLHCALATLLPQPVGRDAAEISLLIGPEGGFAADEIQRATAAGAQPVRLGGLILRTETAVTAALGVVLAWCEAQRDERADPPPRPGL